MPSVFLLVRFLLVMKYCVLWWVFKDSEDENKGVNSSVNLRTIKNCHNKLMMTGAVTYHRTQNFITNSFQYYSILNTGGILTIIEVSLDCIINPPKPQEASYPLFYHETVTFGTYAGVLARTVFNRVNRIPGLSCSPVQAGYCAFIKIDIPPKAVEFAKSISICPSTFYVLEMLQHCGIVTVPGVQYGQSSGPYYFMMSLLKPEEKLKRILTKLQEFQFMFTKKYQS